MLVTIVRRIIRTILNRKYNNKIKIKPQNYIVIKSRKNQHKVSDTNRRMATKEEKTKRQMNQKSKKRLKKTKILKM